jgi:hypothetical protein
VEFLPSSGHAMNLLLDDRAIVIPFLKLKDIKVTVNEENMEVITLEGTSKII